MNSKWLLEKEKLEQLILIDKLSYEEIGRKYNCSGNNIKTEELTRALMALLASFNRKYYRKRSVENRKK